MKTSLGLIAIFILVTNSAMAINKVVYGEDNRLDRFEVIDQNKLDLQRSTVAMIPKSKLKQIGNTSNYLADDSKIDLCDGERFNKQVDVADCSGFLVEKYGKQFIVTAGHCMQSKTDCHDNYWVFDYAKTSPNDDARTINEENIYSCRNIVAQRLGRMSGEDFAVIELNRKVEGRRPLDYRQNDDIRKGEEVFVIGHPSGLPSKVSDNGFVRRADNFYQFETNLDTFSGNSGSAVFNEKTGIVEGILVNGDEDYRYNAKKHCYEVNRCKMEGCEGEGVFRITRILMLRPSND